MSAHATTSVARFSLRNQMLLSAQAEAKGITLTDVDTYKGWWRRGRKPLRTKDALFVTVPSTHRRTTSNNQDGADPDSATEDSEPSQPRGFYMGRRWDISQTAPVDAQDLAEHPGQGDCHGCEARAGQPCEPGCTCFACGDTTGGQSPVEALWNTLQHDITRSGYQFVWPGDTDALNGGSVHVDHEARTVQVSLFAAGEEDGLTALAVVAAEILTRQQHTSSRPAIATPA